MPFSPAKVSLCMIVKDEGIMLRECLKSIQDIADEIIIVDSGSSDDTVQIANEFTDKVYYREWTNSFCEARTHCESLASYEYICRWDGDWVLNKAGLDQMLELKKLGFGGKDRIDGIFCENFDDTDPNIIKMTTQEQNFYIYKKGSFHWESPIHNQLIWNNPKTLPSVQYKNSIIAFHYRTKAKKNWRLAQTVTILEEQLAKNPNDSKFLFYLAREEFLKDQYVLALPKYQKILKSNNNPDFQSYILEKIVFCLLALQRYQEINDYKHLINAKISARNILIQADLALFDDTAKALQLYKKFLDTKFGIENTTLDFDNERYLVHPLIQIAKIHLHQKKSELASNYLDQALKLTNNQNTKDRIKSLKHY